MATSMNSLLSNDQDFYAKFLEDVRKHAPYFSLSSDKQVNETEAALVLSRELSKQSMESFHSISSRGQSNDPPDCEALNSKGERIGIEVTELVHGPSVAAATRGDIIPDEMKKPSELIEEITGRVLEKDGADPKGGPYSWYILIIYCDDHRYLDHDNLEAIRKAAFPAMRLINRVYFLQSYCPMEKRCPYIELRLKQ